MELELGPLRFAMAGVDDVGLAFARALQRCDLEVVHVWDGRAEGRERATSVLEVPAFDDPVTASMHVDCVLIRAMDATFVTEQLERRPGDATPRVLRLVFLGPVDPALVARLGERGHSVGMLDPMVPSGDVPFSGFGAVVLAAEDAMRTFLHALAHAAELHPFDVDEDSWALHAVARTFAADGPTAVMAAVEDLATEMDLHPGLARAAYGRLALAAIDRTAQLGATDAIEGPVLRGDAAAIASQVTAVRSSTSHVDALFIPIVASLANRAFTTGRIDMDAHRALLEAVLDPTQFYRDETREGDG